MCRLADHSLLQGWLTLYVPDIEALMNGGSCITESVRDPNTYEQNEYAEETLLPLLLQVHGEQLASLPCQTAFALDLLTKSESRSLRDLLQFGLDHPRTSAAVYVCLIKEVGGMLLPRRLLR